MEDHEIDLPEETRPDSAGPAGAADGSPAADDHLDWIGGARPPTPVEELPTLHWPAGGDENAAQDHKTPVGQAGAGQKIKAAPVRSPRGVADAMAWLEQMAAGQSEPVDEMPTLVSAQEAEEALVSADAVPNTADINVDPAETDSDPMAWLEQLAVGQVSPLEELPSVADRLLASEIVSQLDDAPGKKAAVIYSAMHGPDQVEEALSYLEQLAAAQGVRWDDVPLDLTAPVGSLEEALEVIDQIALLAAASTRVDVPARPEVITVNAEQPTQVSEEREVTRGPESDVLEAVAAIELSRDGGQGSTAVALDEVEQAWDDLSARMPDDPQEALKWLTTFTEEELASGIILEDDTLPPASIQEEEKPEPPQEKGARSEATGVDFVLDEMPDDPDEAMVWMRHLAARQPQQAAPRAKTVKPEVEAAEKEELEEPESPVVPAPLIHPLLSARKALRKGDLETIVVLYRALMFQSEDPTYLIEDLEQALEKVGSDPRLVKMLGDTYAQTGQLEKAVETYRRGFDQM